MTDKQKTKSEQATSTASRPRPTIRTGVRAGFQDGDDLLLGKKP